MPPYRLLLLIPLLAILSGCPPPSPPAPTLFHLRDAPAAGIAFENTLREDSLHNIIDYSYCYNGGGTGAADLDNDGLPELFFTGNQMPCRLYKNLGSWEFDDRTNPSGIATSGWCTGVTFADVNADGWLDIYVCRAGNSPPEQRANLLFINQKNLIFTEMAAAYGLADTGWSTQAAFFDYDRDGDLDCYILNHTNDDRYPNRIRDQRLLDGSSPASDRLYECRPNAKGQPFFTDVSKKAGIADDGWGLGVGVADLNGDEWPDIYVSNDFLANDLLYLNRRNGTFSEASREAMTHTSHFSMGNDLADFDNDGLTDILVADMMPSTHQQRKKMAGVLSYDAFQMVQERGYAPQYMRNTLQRNVGGYPGGVPRFAEIGQMAGLYATDWSWAPLFADFDCDGWQDAMITSGYRRDIIDMDFIVQNNQLGHQMPLDQADRAIRERASRQPAYASLTRFFKNNGDWTFRDATTEWSAAGPGFAHGAALADADNDGDLDAFVNRLDAPPLLLENTRSGGHFLTINLRAAAQNTFAFGASVKIFMGDSLQIRRLSGSRGYQSAGAPALHFGLGNRNRVDSLVVTWPDGAQETLKNIEANQTLTIRQNEAAQPRKSANSSIATPQNPPSVIARLPAQRYNDFAAEPLLPHGFSDEGPCITTGDIDGDGLEDFFVGGARDHSGQLFFQQVDGHFLQKSLSERCVPEADQRTTAPEDTGCLLFDADGDGDRDLYVAGGSAEFEINSIFYQDRLYLNDGRGFFTLDPARLPVEAEPGSCVAASDFDRDGDLDLFVGGRRTILQYGMPGASFLWENDGRGYFKEMTEQRAPGLKRCGMVTTACWLDADGDGWPDLAVAGELMPIVIFSNKNGHLTGKALPNSDGFWRCLTAADLNGDGKTDLAAGNLGLNHRFGISPSTPLRVYAKDFDGNGYMDPVVTYFVDGREVPEAGRDALCRQIPLLRKRFTNYQSYGQASFEQIFEDKLRQNAHIVRAVESRSIWLENNGNGIFASRNLPTAAQVAPIFDFAALDLDGDGDIDLLPSGNDRSWETGIGAMQAWTGGYLRNDGRGTFAFAAPTHRGGDIPSGEGRCIRLIGTKQGTTLIAVVLAAEVILFKQKIEAYAQ